MISALAAVFALLLSFSPTTHAQDNDEAWVVDQAAILPTEERDALSHELQQFEDQHQARIRLLTLPRLPAGQTLEQATQQFFQQWQLNHQNSPSVLLLVALEERRVRIQTNAGMRRVLSDAAAAQIIEQDIAPAFRSERFRHGIRLAIRSVKDQVLANPVTPLGGGLWWGLLAVYAVILGGVIWFRQQLPKAAPIVIGMGAAATVLSQSAQMGGISLLMCLAVLGLAYRSQQKHLKRPARTSAHAHSARAPTGDHRNDNSDSGGGGDNGGGGASGGW